jgi:G3E family GTPase
MELKTPIALITGSLGSGKTTLLKRILETSTRRLAVLMNEFGEIAIDSQLIQGDNVEIVELTGGCVCCSLTGEFELAVTEIIAKVHPELILVEATGVAEADALVYEVEDNLSQVRLDGVISMVDAYACIRHTSVGYTTRTQLQVADVVVINKVDLVSTEDLAEVEAQIRRYNDTALLLQTVRCHLDVDRLLGLEMGRHLASAAPRGATTLQSFSFVSDRAIDGNKFQQVIAGLPSTIYRAKGFVRTAEGTRLFNYVMGRTDLEEFPASETQLVFIGQHLDPVRGDILSQLHDCEL